MCFLWRAKQLQFIFNIVVYKCIFLLIIVLYLGYIENEGLPPHLNWNKGCDDSPKQHWLCTSKVYLYAIMDFCHSSSTISEAYLAICQYWNIPHRHVSERWVPQNLYKDTHKPTWQVLISLLGGVPWRPSSRDSMSQQHSVCGFVVENVCMHLSIRSNMGINRTVHK